VKKAINRISDLKPLDVESNDPDVVAAFISDEFQDKVKKKRPRTEISCACFLYAL